MSKLLSRLLAHVSRFAHHRSGATAIEYGLIAALIALALIVGAKNLGTKLNTQFNTIATKLNAT